MNKLFKISIKENKELSKNYYLITLHPLEKIIKPVPGQFFMLSVSDPSSRTGSNLDPLLKRPFSLHRWLGRDFQLLYKTVGKATNILKEKKRGDILEVIGPLGNGFPDLKQRTKTVLVAGGLGVAPIFSLAETILKSGGSKPGKSITCFLGAKTKKELLCANKFKSIGIKPVIVTDNGTMGKKGLVTDEVRGFLSRLPSPVTGYRLYACGPKAMLKKLSQLLKKFKIKGYIALEENMACGIGACFSCVVNTKKGFRRICSDGPVFPAEEIIW